MHARIAAIAGLGLAIFAQPAAAQFLSRPDVGSVGVLRSDGERCLLTGEITPATVESFDPVTLLLAGVAGDVASAGMSALGSALEEVSKERSFYGTAVSDISFYTYDTGATARTAVRQTCLMFAVQDASPRATDVSLYRLSGETELRVGVAPPPGLDESGQRLPDATIFNSDSFRNAGLPGRPAFYMEAVLEERADGFALRPRFIWRRGAIGGSPDRPLPGEVHFTFSGPSTPTNFATATFAVAQIPLGPMHADRPLQGLTLQHLTSGVLPLRPTTGSTQTFLDQLRTDRTALKDAEAEVRIADRLIPRAQAALAAATAVADRTRAQDALDLLHDRKQDAERTIGQVQSRLADLTSAGGRTQFGSTNVQARVIVVRNANQFGIALAAALKTRSAALGTAVTTALTPETRSDAWGAADTQYVTAMNLVEEKRAAVIQAQAGGDIAAIFTAELALRNAQASANAAAAASDRLLPFPNLI